MKQVSERDDKDLLNLICELSGRLALHDTKPIHDALVEACNEMGNRLEEYASKGMPDKENEPVAEEKAMEYAVDFYQSNGALDGMPKSIVDDAHRLAALHFSKGYEYAKHKSNLLYDLLKDHTDETIHAQADRIKELEAENKILKMENSHSKLVVDEAKREIERLRG